MTTAEIAEDGSVLAQALVAPGRGLPRAAERRRVVVALLVGTAATLAFAAVAVPRTDVSATVVRRLDDQARKAPDAAEPTAHEREEAIATAGKVAAVGAWSGAALGPTLSALAAAVLLWLGFRVAGTAPGFRPTLAVVAHALLPVWLSRLLAIPALVRSAPVAAEDLGRLLPSSLAALLPAHAPPQLAAAAGAVDLFALWALALVVTGMARASGASRARAAAVTLALWAGYVAVLKVAPAAMAARP
jgi:hypothetical protein